MKWSAGDLNRQANNQANALLDHKFQPGDTVAVWLNESAEKVHMC
jgi:acyl-coenzyme A synthetase/AMP-(fatty) acid ligase